MPKLNIESIPEKKGTSYPAPHNRVCLERRVRRLGQAGGLTKLGVSMVRLPPGSWSSHRHWHTREDEFLYVIRGELVLVTDEGEEIVRTGDCAAFKAGVRNGHCLQNRSSEEAVILAMSNLDDADSGEYPGIDMKFSGGGVGHGGYFHKDGRRY